MSYALLLALGIVFFGFIHSFTASNYFKNKFRRFRRWHYTLISVLTAIPFAYAWFKGYPSSSDVYEVQYPLNLLFYSAMLLGAVIFVLGAVKLDLQAFLGLKEEGEGELSTDGIYKLVRHPLYLGVIIFIWATPVLKAIDIVGNTGLTLYLIIGSYFEEKKLLEEFGEAYAVYKKNTPMLIPHPKSLIEFLRSA